MQTSVRRPAPSRTSGPRAAALLVTVLTTAAALAACGGGGSAPASGSGSGSPGTAGPTPSTSTAGGAPSTGATTGTGSGGSGTTSGSASGGSAATGPGHCTAAQLRYGVLRSEGAAGTIAIAIRVTNTGTRSCWTYGYPGLQILDQAGHKVPTTVLRGTKAPNAGPVPADLLDHPRRVTLAAGGWAWFGIGFNHIDDATVCPTGPVIGTRLAVIAPDTTTPVTLTVETAACGGRLGVSPILAASTLPH